MNEHGLVDAVVTIYLGDAGRDKHGRSSRRGRARRGLAAAGRVRLELGSEKIREPRERQLGELLPHARASSGVGIVNALEIVTAFSRGSRACASSRRRRIGLDHSAPRSTVSPARQRSPRHPGRAGRARTATATRRRRRRLRTRPSDDDAIVADETRSPVASRRASRRFFKQHVRWRKVGSFPRVPLRGGDPAPPYARSIRATRRGRSRRGVSPSPSPCSACFAATRSTGTARAGGAPQTGVGAVGESRPPESHRPLFRRRRVARGVQRAVREVPLRTHTQRRRGAHRAGYPPGTRPGRRSGSEPADPRERRHERKSGKKTESRGSSCREFICRAPRRRGRVPRGGTGRLRLADPDHSEARETRAREGRRALGRPPSGA